MGNHTAEGTGTNKKAAKRTAAENMLEILGFKVPQAQPAKPALKSEEKVTLGVCPCFLTTRRPPLHLFREFGVCGAAQGASPLSRVRRA